MKLSDYPVPNPNNKFGIHLLPRPCQDISDKPVDWHRGRLLGVKAMGGSWVAMLTSPGGQDWTPGTTGCSELTFQLALQELELGVMLRIWCSGVPPKITPEIEVMLRRMLSISGGHPFYLKFDNEIDAEWKAATGRYMTESDARWCCRSVAEAIDKVWDIGQGQVIPSFLNVGYGGSGFEFFRLMHEEGHGDCLDRCWLPVHPYNGAWLEDWPWSETLLAPLLMTEVGYQNWGRWAWQLDNAGARQTLEFVNAARLRDHAWRQELKTFDDLILAYAYGMFTYRWPIYQLAELGHHETPLLFAEWGTRVGEQVEGLPCVGPKLHKRLSLRMIQRMQAEPLVLGGALWHEDSTAVPVVPNFVDQGLKAPNWSFEENLNMPAEWRTEIETSGQLPLVDHLLRHPVGSWPVSKLWFHVQDPSAPGLEAALTRARPGGVKVMGAALNAGFIARVRELVPGVFIVGRFHRDPDNQPYEDDPEARAVELVRDIIGTGCLNLCDAWESYNEVATSRMGTDDPVLRAERVWRLDRFFVRFHREMRALGVKHTIIINSPVGNLGWPGEVHPCDFRESLAEPDVIVGLHGYEFHQAPANDRRAYLFRPYVLAEQVLNEYPDMEFIITEAGVTRAAVPGWPHDTGWAYEGSGYTREEYLQVIRDSDAQARLFPEVRGVCWFETGCAGDWRARGFESLEEVAQVITEEPQAEQPPAEDPGGGDPGPEPINDAEAYGVTIVPAVVAAGQPYWKAVYVHHRTAQENDGARNVFLDVLDEQGRRVMGARLDAWWGSGLPDEHARPVIDKTDALAGADVVLWNVRQVTSVRVDHEGLPSDVVAGMHTDHGDEDVEHPTNWGHPGNTTGHHSFVVRFEKEWAEAEDPGGGEDPGEEPGPDPEDPWADFDEAEFRDFASKFPNEGGPIEYNPTAGLQKEAAERDLGVPLTRESGTPTEDDPDRPPDYLGKYRWERFALAYLVSPINLWHLVRVVEW